MIKHCSWQNFRYQYKKQLCDFFDICSPEKVDAIIETIDPGGVRSSHEFLELVRAAGKPPDFVPASSSFIGPKKVQTALSIKHCSPINEQQKAHDLDEFIETLLAMSPAEENDIKQNSSAAAISSTSILHPDADCVSRLFSFVAKYGDFVVVFSGLKNCTSNSSSDIQLVVEVSSIENFSQQIFLSHVKEAFNEKKVLGGIEMKSTTKYHWGVPIVANRTTKYSATKTMQIAIWSCCGSHAVRRSSYHSGYELIPECENGCRCPHDDDENESDWKSICVSERGVNSPPEGLHWLKTFCNPSGGEFAPLSETHILFLHRSIEL